jgi:hypothetical protein
MAGVLAISGLALFAAPGQAGVYSVQTCRIGTGGWAVTAHTAATTHSASGCPSGVLEIQLRGDQAHAADDAIAATFAAPANTDIQSYSLWRGVQLSWPYNYYFNEIAGSGAATTREQCLDTCGAVGDYNNSLAPASLLGASNRTDVHGLQLLLTCAVPPGSSSSCEKKWPGARLRLGRADITLRDQSPPEFKDPSPSGTLVSSSAPLAGVQPVTVSAKDSGGGVYQLLFEVDGSVVDQETIDDNGGRCRQPFTVAMPCKASVNATVGFDTSKVADGSHMLRLLVTDATGTNVAAWGPVRLQTANASCNPNPRVAALRLRTVLARGRRSTTVGYGHRVRVRGQLLTPQGTPVGGASLCIAAATDLPQAGLRLVGAIATDPNGRFSYLAQPRSSQRLYFVNRVAGGAVAASVHVGVRASTTFSASRRSVRTGQSVVFRGRLRGQPIPHRGVRVELQALRADGWSTFGHTVRANSRGRFRLRYRFTRTRGVQTYEVRARVAEQAGYPFATGISKPLRLHVRG